ncbi:MAG: DUF4124 domain-containing protein [Burkholderiaceae bacterium]|nr:DUF4124 domain-containing protein [Burkholderiaceae bacterium]
MKSRWFFCLSLIVPMAASATDIYRWVDENGRTQLSDIVPAKYRDSAIKLDSRRYEAPVERSPNSSNHGVTGKAPASQAADKPSAQPANGVITPEPGTVDNRQKADTENDCQALRQRYRESQECFAPYFVKGGGIKTEAFEKCGTPVPDPSATCGTVPPEE